MLDLVGARVWCSVAPCGMVERMADNSERIAEIQELLRSGVSSTNVDGVQTTFDLASLRRELRQLMAEDDTNAGRRPVATNIRLSGF